MEEIIVISHMRNVIILIVQISTVDNILPGKIHIGKETFGVLDVKPLYNVQNEKMSLIEIFFKCLVF